VPELVPADDVGAAELEDASAASGLSTDAAKYAATSSIQIGWISLLPRRSTGVTGASARAAEGGQDPAVAGEDEARRKITCSSRERATSCSISHFAW
jgi:hypothetical protein